MTLSRRTFVLGTTLLLGGSACGRPGGSTSAPLVDQVRMGCYVHPVNQQANPVSPVTLTDFEHTLGRRFDIIHYFFGWNSSFQDALNANVRKRDLMISWNPDGQVIRAITTGSQDAYITEYAQTAKAYGRVVYLRFAAEMNGEWNSYSAAGGGPPAFVFVTAWRRLIGIFRAVGAHNVKFIWCPNETDYPDLAGNHLEDYWPGASWVDILGFDGYNWSVRLPRRGTGSWRSFDQICASPYARVGALSPSIPIWVCEIGCAESGPGDPPGATKGGWFEAMFRSRGHPRLASVIYFSDDDVALRRDWRINSSPESIAGWRRGWLS